MAGDDSYFNYTYYAGENSLQALSDNMANSWEYVISFYHVPTGKAIYFKAFITSFAESYNSSWNEEQVYGRADPIYLFSSTKRDMTLVFDAVAESEGEAYENLGKVGKLSRFLYPVYKETPVANTIAQSPLVRLKVMNLVRTLANDDSPAAAAGNQKTPAAMYKAYASSKEAQFGLLGAITNIAINHNIEGDHGVVFKGPNTILPKHINISVTFNAIHEHPLGWQVSGETALFGTLGGEYKTWPYGVQLMESVESAEAPPPSSAPTTQAEEDESEAEAMMALVNQQGGIESLMGDYDETVTELDTTRQIRLVTGDEVTSDDQAVQVEAARMRHMLQTSGGD